MSMTGDPSIMSNPLMFNMFPLISNSWTTEDQLNLAYLESCSKYPFIVIIEIGFTIRRIFRFMKIENNNNV